MFSALSSFSLRENIDSLVHAFHQNFHNLKTHSFKDDSAFLNGAYKISALYLEKNDLYNALKYNKIQQQFYEKITHENHKVPQGYLERVFFDCMIQRITAFERKESFNEALELAFNILRTYERDGIQTERTAKLEVEIGYIYYLFGNYSKALSFYLKAIELIKTTNDLYKIGSVYNDLYGIYSAMGDKNAAIKYCFSALNCFKKTGHTEGERIAYGNLALYYEDLNLDKALSYELRSLELRKDSIDFSNPGFDENISGRLYLKKAQKENDTRKKKDYLVGSERSFAKAMRIAHWLRDKSIMKDCLWGLAALEKEKKNFEAALNYMSLYTAYKDSIIGEQNNSASINSLLKYEFKKKEREQQLINEKKEAVKQKEVEKQKILKNVFIGGFAAATVLAVFIFAGLRNTRKAHKIISAQKSEVERQKKIVEDKQSQLVNSINYAQRIQDNLLRSEEALHEILPESFIFFKPRDIVSGDFYWFSKTEKEEIIIILGDCTGHGVPGALLSMIGITAINEIVNHRQITDPGKILQRLSTDLHDAFSNEKSLSKTDGMDLSVCKISPAKKKIYFAGVNQNLFSWNKEGGLIKIEPQINSVNGILDIKGDQKIIVIEGDLSAGNSYYLSSDGFIDQIGEKTGKKYLQKRLEEFIAAHAHENMPVQKEKIKNEFEQWRGNYRQIDDVCLIGFRA